MARWFECPYLDGEVELTDEREAHVAEHHNEVLRAGLHVIADALEDPDLVRQDRRAANTVLISRWYDDEAHRRRGAHTVVVVVTDEEPRRHWIVSAFIARRIPERDVIWRRS